MSDIWSVGGSDSGSIGKAGASEDWQCSSSDGESAERPRKRAKKNGSRGAKRPVLPVLDSSQPQGGQEDDEGEEAADEDDLLAAYLAHSTHSTKHSRQEGKGRARSPSPLLAGTDFDDLLVAPAAAAAGGQAFRAAPSPDPVRQAAVQQRALHAKLAQAQHACEEEEDDEVEVLDSDSNGRVDLTGAAAAGDDEDDALQLLDELGGSQLQAGVGGTGGDHDKLPLVFQAQGRDKVTVRVQRSQPLSHALETFSKYAAEQGWGRVTKFEFDGERLTGAGTPADLGMEDDDVIDAYLLP